MTRLLRLLVAVAALAAGLALAPSRAAAQGYVVVVNAANPLTSLSRHEAAMLFLKQKLTWSSGEKVVPVDLARASSVRAAFSQKVLGRTVGAVSSYWQGQIFAGGQQPPAEKATDDAVLALVRTTPNAIGYVSADAPLPAGVKAIAVR